MKFRTGDIVTIRGKIVNASGEFGRFKPLSGPSRLESCWVEAEDIVSVEPRPLKVGDTISYLKTEYQVVGRIDGFIWVRDGNRDPLTINENNPRIERVEK